MNKIAMTYDNYKDRTGLNGDRAKRGAALRIVDLVFKEYENGWNNATNQQKQARTLALYTAAVKWLRDKENKSGQKRYLTGVAINQNLINRRSVLQQLARQLIVEMEADGQIDRARKAFETHKVDTLQKGTTRPTVKPLDGGYVNEKLSWDGSGKRGAFSGSVVHGQRHNGFNELNLKTYNEIASGAAGGANLVLYLRKVARLELLVDIDGAGLLCDALTRRPLDWPIPALNIGADFRHVQRDLHMYAMDRYGNLFHSEELAGGALAAKAVQLGQGQNIFRVSKFNHSSFNAGRDVICAGMIGIRQGQLVWIDHNSGHYKPSADHLKECLNVLANDGADLGQCRVGNYIYRPNGNIDRIDIYSAADFIAPVRGPRLMVYP